MNRTALLLLLTGCLKAGTYPLAATQDMPASAEFQVKATAGFLSQPGSGSDLLVHLDLRYTGPSSAKVDLMKIWWKVDGVSWQRCRHAKDVDRDTLIFQIKPDQPRSFDLVCRDIPRPYKSVELKFHTAGTGNLGVVSLAFEGIPQPL